MKTSSPQTTGLDSPRPGMAVFHTTLVLSAAFHVVGSEKPSATPAAAMPRNCGQSTPGFGARGAAVRAMQVKANAAEDDQESAHRGTSLDVPPMLADPRIHALPFVPAVWPADAGDEPRIPPEVPARVVLARLFRYNWRFQPVVAPLFVRKWRNWQTRKPQELVTAR